MAQNDIRVTDFRNSPVSCALVPFPPQHMGRAGLFFGRLKYIESKRKKALQLLAICVKFVNENQDGSGFIFSRCLTQVDGFHPPPPCILKMLERNPEEQPGHAGTTNRRFRKKEEEKL